MTDLGEIIDVAPRLRRPPCPAADRPRPTPRGLQNDVSLPDPSPLAAGPELARRTLSPLTALRLRTSIPDRLIDPAEERFVLYVPEQAPPAGYGLLVFISPSDHALLPLRWGPVLDRHGMIFVSPAHAGNDTKDFERREPLALTAAANVMARYKIDPARVYVAGFSGGSRVALRLALAYPDLFRGALLNAGSDPIGAEVPSPPAALLRRFQETSRLVYLTGARDDFHMAMDGRSRQSMQEWCVFDIATEIMPWADHGLADAASFGRGLDDLEQHIPSDPTGLNACRARLDQVMATEQRQIPTDDHNAAWRGLAAFDGRYGGLAAEQSLALAERLSR